MRKGKPKPSLRQASAEMISRRGRATYLSAKGPLATAWDRTGSVHVTAEAMARAPRRVILGTVARKQAVVRSHIMVMMGMRHMKSSFLRCQTYLAGSW